MAEYKILVPLDGSRLAEHSLTYLKPLTCLGEVKVRLLSVVDASEHHPGLDEIESRERGANLQATYLREVCNDVHQHANVEVDTQIITGVPAYCLANEVSKYKPDLLVLSTHGRSGISRWRFGSVADKLIRSAECNTLVIGPRSTGREAWVDTEVEPPFRSILVPLDGSELAENAISVARRYACSFGSRVHLVRAVSIPTVISGLAAEAVYEPEILDDMIKGAKEYLAKITCSLAPLTNVRSEVRTGEAGSVLEAYAQQHAVDLVIMTSHGRGGMVRTALGSVTDRVLSTAVAPVLIVRPQEEA